MTSTAQPTPARFPAPLPAAGPTTPADERYARWETASAFGTTEDPGAPAWAMVLPPPNITGDLHMGHAYEHTLSDALTRWQRMRGHDCLWLPGLDHASIATNALLERQLRAEGTSRAQIGREEFLRRAWAWKAACQAGITTQMRSLGASPDWSRLVFTLDEGPARATRTAFVRLFDEGLVFRAERDTLWCPGCATTISDIEATDGERGPECSRCTAALATRRTPQWYLRTSALAAAARDAVLDGTTSIDPADARRDYLRWTEDMHDWCISRQQWWGHRIPVWHGPDGQLRAFATEEDIPTGWTQDPDTLDTWFSSALWPLATLGWPDHTPDLRRYYPNDLLITGNDLIFFWALRMMMLCTHLAGRPPFRRMSFHGMVRDERGKKMSKSFGNAVDPLPLIAEHGADALRFALARRARPGADLSYGPDDLKGARGFATKLRSITGLAARVAGMWQPYPPEAAHLLDRWLLTRLAAALAEAQAGYDTGDLARVAAALTRLAEDDLSALYLEARKDALYAADAGARATLSYVLTATLLALHPLSPFSTEELAESLGWSGIMDQEAWPTPPPEDAEGAAAGDQLRELLEAARSHRARAGFPPAALLPARGERITLWAELQRTARLAAAEADADGGTAECVLRGPTTRITRGGGTLLLPAAPEPDDEQCRVLTRRLADADARTAQLQRRLADPLFAQRAPQAAQQQARTQLEASRREQARLGELLGGLPPPAW